MTDSPHHDNLPRWHLWRHDDNGFRERIASFATETEARIALKRYDKRGLEQTYVLDRAAEDPGVQDAHEFSIRHRRQLEDSDLCGCFYCCATFPPSAIMDWTDVDEHGVGQTALCPRCGIDAVIGSASGYPITREFLNEMRASWF